MTKQYTIKGMNHDGNGSDNMSLKHKSGSDICRAALLLQECGYRSGVVVDEATGKVVAQWG